MITQSILNTANQLKQSLDFVNKKINLIPSKLSVLVNTIYVREYEVNVDNLIAVSSQVNKIDLGSHGQVQDVLTDQLHASVCAIHDVAKNKVLFYVNEIKRLVESEKINNVKNASNADLNIEMVEVPTILMDDLFLALINNFNLTNSLTSLNSQEINTLYKLNGKLTDDNISQLSVTDNSLLDGRLVQTGITYDATIAFNSIADIVESRTLKSLMQTCRLFVILNNIIHRKIDQSEFIFDDDKDEVNLLSIRNKLATFITNKKNELFLLLNTKDILAPSYYGSTGSEKVILVFGKKYRQWLKDGGSVEAIKGYYSVNGNNVQSVYELSTPEGISKYTRKYNSILDVTKNIDIMTEQKIVKSQFRKYMSSVLSNIEHNDGVDKQQLILDYVTKEPYGSDIIDYYLIKGVCKCLVEKDDVLEFILDTQRILLAIKADPHNIRESMDYALQLATINMLSCWVARQIQVSDKNGY